MCVCVVHLLVWIKKILGLTVDETFVMEVSLLVIHWEIWAFCAFGTVTPHMAEETLRMICFSYVHSLITNGVILEGGGSHRTIIMFLRFKNE